MTLNESKFKCAGLIAGALLLIFATSCSTDDDDNGDSAKGDKLSAVSLVATADLNFIDEEETLQLNCYKLESYAELTIYGDTLFSLRLSDTDLYGSVKMTASIMVSLVSKTGFEAGMTYQFADIQYDDESSFFLTKYKENGVDPYFLTSGSDADGEYSDTGSLTITAISNNLVEGTFAFTAHSLAESPKKVEVTNGVFHGDLYRIQ